MDEIRQDIDTAHKMAEEIQAFSRALHFDGQLNDAAIGRPGGAFQSRDDLTRLPQIYPKISQLAAEVGAGQGEAGIERLVAELVDRNV